MTEGNAREPIDTDGDVCIGFYSSGQFEFASSRRTGTDEVSIELHVEHVLHAGDLMTEVALDTHVENQVDLFVQYVRR